MYVCSITTCKKKFKGRNGRANKYCGAECYNTAQRDGKYKTGRKSLPCKACSKPVFHIYEKDKNHNPKTEYFCRDCHIEFLVKQRGNCERCKEPIPARKKGNKYCSKKCNDDAKRTLPRYCTECNAYFTPITLVKKPSGESKYVGSGRQMQCNSECGKKSQFNEERNKKISEAHKGEKHWNYRDGSSEYRGPNWDIQRKLALKRDNYLCIECGAKNTKKNPLHVHHKWPYDCFRDYRKANELDNLEVLCARHHKSKHIILDQLELPYVRGQIIRPGTARGEQVGTSKFTNKFVVNLVELISKGTPLKEISKTFNISMSHLNSIANGKSRIHATGGKIKGYKKSPAKGTKIAKARLNDEQASNIKKLLAKKVHEKNIAIEFGVHANTIKAIKYGKTWQHVS